MRPDQRVGPTSPTRALWWKRLWRTCRAAVRPSASAPTKELAVLSLEGVQFVFGLDWRLLPPTRRLSRALAMAREEGQTWYAVSELEDVLGFVDAPRWLRGAHHSASLHLAAGHSQGGLELFVLHFSSGQLAVLALQESRPLPGFDFLGDMTSARALIDEFLAIQRGQPIRLVGNVDFQDGFEQVSPEDLLVEPLANSRLRSLRSWRALRRGLMLGLVAMAVGWGGHYLLEYRRQQTLAQLEVSPAYQQQLYQDGLRSAWAALPPAADEVLKAWTQLLERLPLRVQGWQLSQIECQLGQCRVHWSRQQGSHADFLAHMPIENGVIDEAVSDLDPMAGRIVTRHDVTIPAGGLTLDRQNLPDLRLARRTLADLLNDVQLLGPSLARVDTAQLFGGTQDPELLGDAVFSGSWSLKHALWVLPELSLPDFVRVTTLNVDVLIKPRSAIDQGHSTAGVSAERNGTASSKSMASPTDRTEAVPIEPWFEIAGTYHAKR